MLPTKPFDDNFWDWYERFGPSWLMTHRKDILDAMYLAYKDTVSVEVDENVTVAALKSDAIKALTEMMELLHDDEEEEPILQPKMPITNTEINDFEKALKKRIRLKLKEDE